jgi:hypothetical protein
VAHGVDELGEGEQIIVTLRDTEVLERDEHGKVVGTAQADDQLEDVRLAER